MSDPTTAGRRRTGRIAAATAVGLVVLVALAGGASAHTGDDGSHHHDGWMSTHDGAGLWMGGGLWLLLWTIVLLGGAAGVAYLALARNTDGDSGPGDDALAVLRQRYAAGKIDDEEFEARRERLAAEE